jgi:hypothetical protein
MHAPTRLRIGPLTYHVRFGDEDWYRSNGEHMGQCDNLTQTLTIKAKLSPDHTACTFLHEITHAVMYAGCWIADNNLYDDESVCNIASYGLVQVWRDNPTAFEWLQEMIDGKEYEDAE